MSDLEKLESDLDALEVRMTKTAHLFAHRPVSAVLRRYDDPGMRRDLAYWYGVTIDEINEIALSITLEG